MEPFDSPAVLCIDEADNMPILQAQQWPRQVSVRDRSKAYQPSSWMMFACPDTLGRGRAFRGLSVPEDLYTYLAASEQEGVLHSRDLRGT